MSRTNLITGLDIGSSTIKVAVGQWVNRGTREQPHIVAALEVPSDGISRGIVRSIDDAVSSVSAALERAEKIVGLPLANVYLAISGTQILSEESRGVVGISRADGEIGEQDVERAIEAARTFATPSNYDILHVVPRSFSVDGETSIKDPVGMHGIRLEVSAYIIQSLSSQIKNLTKCVYRAGLEINDLVLGTLASAELVLTNRDKELGAVFLNIGAAATGIVVYEGGELLYTGSVPIGGEHITSDIAIGLRTSFEVAEKVKLRHGTASGRDISRKVEINLRELGAVDDEMVSLKYIADIIEARVDEIFGAVDGILRKLGKSAMLPAGTILTGGSSKLPGIIDVAKRKLRLAAILGYPIGISSVSDRVTDPAFATVLGLVRWGAEVNLPNRSALDGFLPKFGAFEIVAKQMRGLFGLFKK